MFRPRTDSRTATASLHAELLDEVLTVSGPDLDQVLAEVGDRLGPDAEVIDARRAIVGGIGGFFGREEFTVEARVPAGSPVPVQAEDEPENQPKDQPEHQPQHGPEDQPEHEPALNGATFAAALAEALAGVDDVHRNLSAAAVDLLHDPEPTTPAVPAFDESAWRGAPILALTAPELADDQLRAHLSGLVGTPPVLPLHGVVAVVGDPADAVATAELLATRNGLDPADVLVAAPGPIEGRAAWLTVSDPTDAARRSARWSSSKRLIVVAVALNPGLAGLQWTRAMLEAVGAHQVRLAVAGWRHFDEVVPRLQGLRRVDAIDLCAPVDAAAASDFLGLPVPVGLLSGRPATVDAWMDLLRPPAAVRPAAADLELSPLDATREDAPA